MPEFQLPPVGAYVRVVTVEDTLHGSELQIVLVNGGVIMGRWCKNDRNEFVIVTLYTKDTFHRLQKRDQSRFVPITSKCYEVVRVLERPLAA